MSVILLGYHLAIPDAVELPEIRAVIKTRLIAIQLATKKRQKSGWKINIDADKIALPLEISGIKPGDKFSHKHYRHQFQAFHSGYLDT